MRRTGRDHRTFRKRVKDGRGWVVEVLGVREVGIGDGRQRGDVENSFCLNESWLQSQCEAETPRVSDGRGSEETEAPQLLFQNIAHVARPGEMGTGSDPRANTRQ